MEAGPLGLGGGEGASTKSEIIPFCCLSRVCTLDHGNIDPVTVVFVIALSELVCASVSYTGFVLWESGFISWNIFGSFLCVTWSFR